MGCNPNNDVKLSSNCLNTDIEPIPISDIIIEIEPALKEFGFKLKKTSDNGFLFFIPFWGDAFKFSEKGNYEWKVSFNSKSLSDNKDRINHLSGTTPDFDVFENRIFFLHSNETISVYNLNGKEILKYPINIQGLMTEKLEVLNETELVLGGIMVDQGKFGCNFFKIDLKSNSKVLIKKMELDSKMTPYLVNLNSYKAYILGDRDSFVMELDLLEKNTKKIDFSPSKNRDYNNYSIPSNIDYFSLTDQEKRKYRNDKTRRFTINGSEILIFHEIANRTNDIDESYNLLLTKHQLSKSEVKEKFDVDWGIDFDECGNIFQIENVNGDYFIVPKTFNDFD
jgi:hypothetical protein